MTFSFGGQLMTSLAHALYTPECPMSSLAQTSDELAHSQHARTRHRTGRPGDRRCGGRRPHSTFVGRGRDGTFLTFRVRPCAASCTTPHCGARWLSRCGWTVDGLGDEVTTTLLRDIRVQAIVQWAAARVVRIDRDGGDARVVRRVHHAPAHGGRALRRAEPARGGQAVPTRVGDQRRTAQARLRGARCQHQHGDANDESCPRRRSCRRGDRCARSTSRPGNSSFASRPRGPSLARVIGPSVGR